MDEWVQPVVDPEVRAFVTSLVNALGGTSAEHDGRYMLGDDALACLKDIRRWLRLYDQRLNRFDVARCLAEANLVKGDLLEILSAWPESAVEDKLKQKILLGCLELLIPLTWPFEIEGQDMKVNHHRHKPYLQLAQVGYKRAILHHDGAKILRIAIRLALPSMALPKNERTPRDDGVIKIVLYLLRNIAMITQPPNLPSDGDEADISRSAMTEVFHEQDVFSALLSISSSMGDEFVQEDVIVLEILFYLLKGVDADKLFMEEDKLASTNAQELKGLIQKEKAMLAGYARHAPTRHNRFGTMIWVKRDDEKVSTVSGQDVLADSQRSYQKMDKTKKWNKPKHRGRDTDNSGQQEFDLETTLTTSARKHLREFVDEFIDSSFNPLFTHLRKAIERETDRVLSIHSRQYFYLVSWFLRAECARRSHKKAATEKAKGVHDTSPEDDSFSLVAGVLNQETFILLNRFMQRSQDDKSWQDLNAGMKCFTQILLTVQEMSQSSLEEDEEIAENILNRIFYEESTHDRIIAILRSYKDQGFGYLDACTELAHVFLRMLERYSKQNIELQVRSRRRTKNKSKPKTQTTVSENGPEADASEAEELAEAQCTTSERKFDFHRFAARFTNQGCVDTFVAFTRFYNDLSEEQLKRAHRFFYRVAFKMELGIILYRVDIMFLFQKMIKGPEGLDSASPVFKEWEELTRQVFRRAIKKIQERPELVVEMLFSKINATTYYLEHGHDRELPTKNPRAPAELVVKGDMEKPDQIGVAVSILVNQNKSDALAWVKGQLVSAIEERRSWEAAEAAKNIIPEGLNDQIDGTATEKDTESKPPTILIKPDSEEHRIALFKDNKLRLLLKLLGFERIGEDDDINATWIIPSSLPAAALDDTLELVRKFERDPPIYEDGKTAEDLIRSKTTVRRKRATFEDDSEGNDSQEDEDFLFPAGGPTTRKSDALDELKGKRRKRRNKSPKELDDEEKQQRAEARRKADLEKRKKIKSDVYVHESDDETDEERDREFFERENQIREAAKEKIMSAILTARKEQEKPNKRKSMGQPEGARKRRKGSESGSDTSDNDTEDIELNIASRSVTPENDNVVGTESDADDFETPLSSQHHRAPESGSDAVPGNKLIADHRTDADPDTRMGDSDDDEDVGPIRATTRRRVRAGFLVDSDSE